MCSVRGIGVAESASTSTSRRSWRSSSFCATPNRCSSSTITRPSSFGITSRDRIAVRADQHLDLSFGKVVKGLLRVLARSEARDHLDADGEVAVARLERVPVLLREHGRRHEHQDLLAVDRDGERGAQRHLGLAEADVAADEAVHRMRRLEALPSPPRSPCAGRRSRGKGTPPRAARPTRARRRTRHPVASAVARRAGAARRRARACARAPASSGCPTPCRRASTASARACRRRCIC